MSRGLVTDTIQRFKGIDQKTVATATRPEFALDCVNVFPSSSGGLEKARLPVNLSAAIGGTGPDSFAQYENSLVKQVLAFFGADIYKYDLDSFVSTLLDSNALNTGVWSVVVSNSLALCVNGQRALKWNGTAIQNWGIQKAGVVTLGAKSGGAITLLTGRKYRVAYKDPVTGHVGTASNVSASTGVMAAQQQALTLPAPATADSQITAARLYATLDGGDDYFFHSEVNGPFPIALTDNTVDTGLTQAERAPLINDMPPVGKYLTLWGTRTFIFNITGDTQGIAYTGFNRILVGRPEQSCPPSNRLRLATGADQISGGGVITAGVVAFDRSNKMFMFRGQPEDITNTAPVEFTLFLQQLPWDIGCASHFTICNSDRGLVWLTPDREVCAFDGIGKPMTISGGVEPIMRRITSGTESNARAVYWHYVDRDWYVLALAVDNSYALNMLLIFDLDDNPDTNCGVFPLDLGSFQSLSVLEMADGSQKLVVGQAGVLKEIKTISTATNGVNRARTTTAGTLGAFWRSGYFGNPKPQMMKFMRWLRCITDNIGFQIKRYLVDDDNFTVESPRVIEHDELDGSKMSTNAKAKRMSIEIKFPDTDVDCTVLELQNVYVPTGER